MPKSSRFAVFGIGRYGHQIALSLAAKGAEVFTFDSDPSRSEAIKDEVALAVTMDATDARALQAQNVQDMDAAVVAIGENFEATMLTSMNLLDLGVPRVIVRSSGDHQKRILTSLGIREILTPESEVASIVSERLIHPNIGGFLELPDDYEIAEIHAPQNCIGRTLGSIDLTNRTNFASLPSDGNSPPKQKVEKSRNTSSVSPKRRWSSKKRTPWSYLERSTE